MSTQKDMALSHMRLALSNIAAGDCYYTTESERPDPCHCPACTAKIALVATADWRYEGASPERRHHRHELGRRESAFVDAWREVMGTGWREADRALANLLRLVNRMPTPDEWRVATSVIQFLGTNGGQELLRLAGYGPLNERDPLEHSHTTRELLDIQGFPVNPSSNEAPE